MWVIVLASSMVAATAGASNSPPPPVWTSIGPVATPDLLAGFLPTSVVQNPSSTYGLPAAGEITAVAVVDANPQIMYAGAGGGYWWGGADSQAGLFKTTDGGQTWAPVTDGLVSHTVLALWVDQTNPSTVVAATAAGVFRTTSAGATWAREIPGSYRHLVQANSDLYAGGESGLEVSTDAGATWSAIAGTGAVTALGAGGGKVLVGIFNGIVMSGSGDSFTQVYAPAANTPAPHWSQIVVDPSDPSTAFASDPVAGAVFESTDGGASWSVLGLPPTPALGTFSVRTVAVDPVDPNLVFVGGDETFDYSTDGGRTFKALAVGVDLWGIAPLVGAPGSFLATTDQGLYRVSDDGATWTSLNGDLSTGLIQSVSVNGSTILARAQDFSIIASYDGGRSWQMLTGAGGENGEILANPTNPQYVYGMGTADGLTYSADGGHNWVDVASVPAVDYTSGNQVFAVDPAEPSKVYVATTGGVYVSTDWGRTWSPTGWPYSATDVVAINPANPMDILVGTHGTSVYPQTGALYESRDGGVSWSAVKSPEPFVSSVAFTADGGVYLGGTSGVYVRAAGTATFQSLSAGLPNLPTSLDGTILPGVISLARADLSGSPTLFASTSDGLFALGPSGRWIDVSANLTSRIVWQFTTSGDSAYVATYGEGVAAAPLASLAAIVDASRTTAPKGSAALRVAVETPSGAVTTAVRPGDVVVASLTPPPRVSTLAGSCELRAGPRILVTSSRRVDRTGPMTCRWVVPSWARPPLHGWIEVRTATGLLRRSFSVA